MARNRRAKERVQAIQSLMEHVAIAANMDARQAIVGAMSVHPGTPKVKARTARTRKGRDNQAGPLDDAGQTREPVAETGSLGLGSFEKSSRSIR